MMTLSKNKQDKQTDSNGHKMEPDQGKNEAGEHLLYCVESQAAVEEAVRAILVNVGEDPEREGLLDTPRRVAKMYQELLEGYAQTVEGIIGNALFDVEYGDEEMIVVKDIEFNSMCEHHMLPFIGKAHVAYIPTAKVVGLSKIPRIVDMYAHRLQVQEQMTNQIADALYQHLDAAGVIVIVDGEHSCASLRGVKKHGSSMITSARRGSFRSNQQLVNEFYKMIGR
jgi:GTP cyclohydrolase IA